MIDMPNIELIIRVNVLDGEIIGLPSTEQLQRLMGVLKPFWSHVYIRLKGASETHECKTITRAAIKHVLLTEGKNIIYNG